MLHNYEFEAEVVVEFSLVATYSFEKRWNLPDFDKGLLPNPLFQIDILSSDRTELKYTQQKINIDVKGWIGIGLNSGGNKKKDTKDLNKMCYPMTWVALTYGVSPLKPHTDGLYP